jgi:hypothetical protein
MISIKQMFIFIDVNYLEKHASMTNKVEGLQQLKRVKTLDIMHKKLMIDTRS